MTMPVNPLIFACALLQFGGGIWAALQGNWKVMVIMLAVGVANVAMSYMVG